MSKHSYPAPELASIIQYLPTFEDPSIHVRLVVRAALGAAKAYALAEVYQSSPDGKERLIHREGELVGGNSLDVLAGAWFRAVMRLETFLDGKSTDDLVKWAEWHPEGRLLTSGPVA